MSELGDIREALADALRAIPNIDVSAWARHEYPVLPAADIFPGRTEYHQAMQNGLTLPTLNVRVFIGLVSDRAAQERLDRLLDVTGAESVKAALEDDATLGGLVADVTVTEASGYRTYTIGSAQTEALGADWTVEIMQ